LLCERLLEECELLLRVANAGAIDISRAHSRTPIRIRFRRWSERPLPVPHIAIPRYHVLSSTAEGLAEALSRGAELIPHPRTLGGQRGWSPVSVRRNNQCR